MSGGVALRRQPARTRWSRSRRRSRAGRRATDRASRRRPSAARQQRAHVERARGSRNGAALSGALRRRRSRRGAASPSGSGGADAEADDLDALAAGLAPCMIDAAVGRRRTLEQASCASSPRARRPATATGDLERLADEAHVQRVGDSRARRRNAESREARTRRSRTRRSVSRRRRAPPRRAACGASTSSYLRVVRRRADRRRRARRRSAARRWSRCRDLRRSPRVQRARAAERHQHVVARVAAELGRDELDRAHDVGVGQADRAVGGLVDAHAEALRRAARSACAPRRRRASCGRQGTSRAGWCRGPHARR